MIPTAQFTEEPSKDSASCYIPPFQEEEKQPAFLPVASFEKIACLSTECLQNDMGKKPTHPKANIFDLSRELEEEIEPLSWIKLLKKNEDNLDSPDKKKSKEEATLTTLPIETVPFFMTSSLLSTGSISDLHTNLSAEVLTLFDKLCGEMIVMTSENSSKTTLFLNSQEFTSSPLFGAEVTIEEFSTAPKVFNVSISANSQATQLIQANLSGFWEIFQERKFSFSINRIDTEILSKPTFSRRSHEEKNDLDQEQEDKRHS